jgi:potassium efflux system protein
MSLIQSWLTFIVVFGFSASLIAAPVTSSNAITVSQQVLESKIKEVQASTEINEEGQTKLVELYRKAISELDKVNAYETLANEYQLAKQQAPEQTQKIRKTLETPLSEPTLKSMEVSNNSTLAEIEQRLLKEQADLSAVEAKLADIEKQLEDQTNQPSTTLDRLTAAKQKQEQIAKDLKLPPKEGESPAVSEARRWLLQAQNRALSAEIKMLDEGLLSQSVRVELLRVQREEATRNAAFVRARVNLLEEFVAERRLSEAAQASAQAAAAELDAVGKHKIIQGLAQENSELTNNLTQLANKLDAAVETKDVISEKAKQVEEDFHSAKQRLEIAGLSQALGRILLDQKQRLPSQRALRKEAAQREDEITQASLQQVRFSDERRKLSDTTQSIELLMVDVPLEQQAVIKEELGHLFKSRIELLDKAITTNGTYLRTLAELDYIQRRLADAVNDYDEFLAERLLWIRNANMIDVEKILQLPGDVGKLLSPSGWNEVLQALTFEAVHKPILIPVLTIVVVLLGWGRKLRKILKASGKHVGKVSADRFTYSAQALVVTMLLAVSWPLLLGTMGAELVISLEATQFAKAVGEGILRIVPIFLFLRVFYYLCSPYGMARVHFEWPESSVKLIRSQIRLVMLVVLPSALIAVVSSRVSDMGGGVSQLALMVLLLGLAYFFSRILHPKHGVLSGYMARHRRSLLSRLRYIWYVLILGIPVALTVLQLIGYLYTAGVLTQSLVYSLSLILTVVVAHELVVRWLLLTRRKFAYHAARERQLAKSEQPVAGDGDTQKESQSGNLHMPEIDLAIIDANTRKLLNTALVISTLIGIWWIWADVLPAFRILDQVSLWQHIAVIDGEEKLVPITLASAAWALLLAIFTTVAARNLPSVLEISLLQHLQLDTGSRYAVTTLARYTIVGFGIVLVFQALGGSWGQIQWLVAALSVGIGFGLQEIVANFISGIIILFERPIRVGDIVTVGETTGQVTRIRIRATTIRNWDKQELLVPNKEFITARLLNWSLSDQLNRIVVNVGVAYGSDIPKALELLHEAATENPNVVGDPKPIVTFEGFGDNSLNLVLRCYMNTLDNRLETISALHQEVNSKFERAKISISYPQRDLHLDSTRPLEIRVLQSETPEPRSGL